ncbi:GerMN domain-containing protein [Geodermatophilus sp. SYSU D00758]
MRALPLLVAAVLLTGCGIPAQNRPELVPDVAQPPVASGDGAPPAGPRLTVFFVRGADLAPVERRTSAATAVAALDLLVEGPTRRESASGIRTALAPEAVAADEAFHPGTTTVSVNRGFTALNGEDQLLAVAQVVWTLTDLPAVGSVRFTREGTPIEAPTDAGLTDRPVTREDYRSVTPAEPATTPTTGPPAEHADPTAGPAPR